MMDREIFCGGAMCVVHLKDRKRAKNLMLLLGFDKTFSFGYGEQFSMVWSCVVERVLSSNRLRKKA